MTFKDVIDQYSSRSGLLLAFHGCDQSVVEEVILGKTTLRTSHNNYDWLGHGIYFWENSPARALEYAKSLKNNPKKSNHPIENTAVIGAVIDLGHCLDLTDYQNLSMIKDSYNSLVQSLKNQRLNIPQNKPGGSKQDLLLRELDCAVIEYLHAIIGKDTNLEFDSVKGVFWEGKELFPNAGFREKNHIQICIRNPNCIKGFFLPREFDSKFKKV